MFWSPPRRPKRRPRGPKTPPRAPKEAPRGREERPRRIQEILKRPREPPKTSPRHLRSPQSPRARKPKSLATTCRRQKGGRAAVMPLGASQSAARPGGAEPSVLDRTPRSVNLKALICLRHLQISKSEFLAPPIIPPGGQHIPPGRLKKTIQPPFFSNKISIIF